MTSSGLVLGVFASLLQEPSPPTDSALAGITARGRAIVAYDIAAWHGTDAVMALKPTRQITASIARQEQTGRWKVFFGDLSATRDTMYVHYSAEQTSSDSTFLGLAHDPPLAVTGAPARMAAAIRTAVAAFGAVTRPYNAYAIPATPSGIWVYLLPAQTTLTEFPHGADARYWLDASGTRVLASHRFHRTILNLASQPNAVAGMHTSFDSLPAETDVFMVLRRHPSLPELISTEHYHFEVRRDGTIDWRSSKRP